MSARKSTSTPAAAAPKATAPAPAPQTCRCGCGEQVAIKRLFRPGHDARAAGVAARALRAGDPTLRDLLPSQPLQAKATALAAKWQQAAEDKATRAAARAADAAAKAAAAAK